VQGEVAGVRLAVRSPPPSIAPPDRLVVLVVDDDARSRALVRRYLQSQYEVREARNGPDALAAAAGADLVVLDVMMPGMSGFDVRGTLKARTGDFLPVLLVTALHEQEDRDEGVAAGADDFLSKPVSRLELEVRVRNLLALRTQGRAVARQLEQLRELGA